MIGRYLFRFDTRWALGNHYSRFTSNLASPMIPQRCGHPSNLFDILTLTFASKAERFQRNKWEKLTKLRRCGSKLIFFWSKTFFFISNYIFSFKLQAFEFDVIYSSRCMTTVFCRKRNRNQSIGMTSSTDGQESIFDHQEIGHGRYYIISLWSILHYLSMVDITLSLSPYHI